MDTSSPFDMGDAAIERYVYDDIHNGLISLDGGNVVLGFLDPDGSGAQSMALSKRYLYGEVVDQILAQEDMTKDISATDRILWPLVDNLGTVRDLAKQDGTIATHYTYDSYGNVVSGDTALTRYLFTSREWDTATELQYNRARWYDPAVGRWLSEDPIGFVAGDANVQRYVGSRITQILDPTGLESRVERGVHTTDKEFDQYRREFREVLDRMKKMGGLIASVANELSERAESDGEIFRVSISHTQPHATIAKPIKSPRSLSIFPDDDFYPGPPEHFPAGQGTNGPISNEYRRILIIVHEWGHARMRLSDPPNVNVENMARDELGVPRRGSYNGSPVPRLDGATGAKLRRVQERGGKPTSPSEDINGTPDSQVRS